METLYRTIGAVRYLAANGVMLSSEALRKASDRKEIVPIRTSDGARIFTQSILDDFITKRKAKKENASFSRLKVA